MAKQFTYWTAKEVAKFLKISVNNVRQVTYRQIVAHEQMDCVKLKRKCQHMIVEYISGGKAYYDKEKVEAYALIRRGPQRVDKIVTTRQRREYR